jgi:hypothetical protein
LRHAECCRGNAAVEEDIDFGAAARPVARIAGDVGAEIGEIVHRHRDGLGAANRAEAVARRRKERIRPITDSVRRVAPPTTMLVLTLGWLKVLPITLTS